MRRGQSVTFKNFRLNVAIWTQPELRSRFVVRCGISADGFEQQNPGSPGILLRVAFVPMVQATAGTGLAKVDMFENEGDPLAQTDTTRAKCQ